MEGVETLPPSDVEGHDVVPGIGHSDHPMRIMTRRIAGLDEGLWDETARRAVVETFDALAPEWHTRSTPQTRSVVRDALERGLDRGAHERGLAIEIGSGIGSYSDMVALRFAMAVAIDISYEMSSLAPGGPAHRVLADGARLPVRSSAADAVVLINAFLFPGEVDRALTEGGALVWVNTIGEGTPIHLSTSEVVAALPFEVEGVESKAGAGTWCVLWRADG